MLLAHLADAGVASTGAGNGAGAAETGAGEGVGTGAGAGDSCAALPAQLDNGGCAVLTSAALSVGLTEGGCTGAGTSRVPHDPQYGCAIGLRPMQP
jgi:hypothetical protein